MGHPLLLLLVTPTPTSTGRSASRPAAQCLTAPIKSPGRYDITMHPVEPGFVIDEGLTTVRARWTRRPRCTSNGPGRYGWRRAELMQIHDYVSECSSQHCLPRGSRRRTSAPSRLGDTGDTDEQRIEAGGDIPAHIRCGRVALAPAREVMAGAVQVLPPPEGRHQACLGHGGGHTTWTCRTSDQTVYGQPLNKHCTALEGPAAVWISTAHAAHA